MDRLAITREGATVVVDLVRMIKQDEDPTGWSAASVSVGKDRDAGEGIPDFPPRRPNRIVSGSTADGPIAEPAAPVPPGDVPCSRAR